MPKKSEAADDCPEPRVLEELPIPADPAAPSKTEFACDVLVVGGGFAGLNAAISAKKSRELGHHGRQGGGLVIRACLPSPVLIAGSIRTLVMIQRPSGPVFSVAVNISHNLDWYQVWIDESKAAYERLMEWGVLTQFSKASIAGEYFNQLDYAAIVTSSTSSTGVKSSTKPR